MDALLGKIQQPIRVLYEDRVEIRWRLLNPATCTAIVHNAAQRAYTVSIKRVRRRGIDARPLKTDYCAGSSLYHRMGNLSPKASQYPKMEAGFVPRNALERFNSREGRDFLRDKASIHLRLAICNILVISVLNMLLEAADTGTFETRISPKIRLQFLFDGKHSR